MKRSLTVLNVCLVLALLATAASSFAQDQGGGGGRRRGGFGGRGGMGANPLMLLQAEPVQKELELTDDQKASLTKLADENRPAGGGGGFRDLSPEDQQKRLDEMQKQRDEVQAKVNEILLPNQQERLQQITLQLQGARALSDAKVADKLQLTDDEKKQLADLSSDYRQKMMDLFQGGGPPDRDAMAKLRTEENDKAMAILTPEQKDQFTTMQGKKVDIDPAELMRAFRGGRNRGNGGGGGGNAAKGPDA
jgi:Spy/CpxP family protein refolding chaperone